MTIKLIAIDLDGTLLNSQHQMSDITEKALSAAINQGIKIVLATGKTRYSAEPIIKRLNLDTPGVYIQGLVVVDSAGKTLYQRTIPANDVRDMVTLCEQKAIPMVLYSGMQILSQENNIFTRTLTEYGEPPATRVPDYYTALQTYPIHKMMVFGKPDFVTEVHHYLEKTFAGKLSVVQTTPFGTELLPIGASKGKGLKWLLEYLQISPETILAIGDGDNDVEMLHMAEIGIAPANASQAAKTAADYVVSSNDEHGVAEAIERFVLI